MIAATLPTMPKTKDFSIFGLVKIVCVICFEFVKVANVQKLSVEFKSLPICWPSNLQIQVGVESNWKREIHTIFAFNVWKSWEI